MLQVVLRGRHQVLVTSMCGRFLSARRGDAARSGVGGEGRGRGYALPGIGTDVWKSTQRELVLRLRFCGSCASMRSGGAGQAEARAGRARRGKRKLLSVAVSSNAYLAQN